MQVPFSQKVLGLWFEIPEKWRVRLVSVFHTFLGAFAFELIFQIQPLLASGKLPSSWDALVALGVGVTREATKYAWVAVQTWVSAQIDAYKQSKMS